MSERARIDITASEHVTAIVYPAAGNKHASIRLILAHGAGASQSSTFIVRFATALAERGFPTVTFNFLYTEQGRRVPDRNDKLEATYRKVIEACRRGPPGARVDGLEARDGTSADLALRHHGERFSVLGTA